MVEPLFFCDLPESIESGQVLTLDGEEAKHAISSRRMTEGEAISLADGFGRKVRGQVASIGKNSLLVKVSEVLLIPEPSLRLCLVQALAKGDRDELAIQAATELGVSQVIPWQAERSISIWKDEKKAKGLARWMAVVTEASKQSLRARVPIVHPVLSGAELISFLGGYDRVLVLEPTAKKGLTETTNLPTSGSIAVVIGPEGGISPAELSAFEQAGFALVRLGEGILRTSTAAIASIAYLHSVIGEWK